MTARGGGGKPFGGLTAKRDISLAILCLLSLDPAPVNAATAPDPAADRRLASRVTIEAEGIPIDQVLRTLSAKTGVRFTSDRRLGDERLVAFVPESSLSDVMGAVANLYRSTWVAQGDPERPAYRLQQTPAAAREEDLLRRACLQRIVQRLAFQLRNPPQPNSPRDDWTAAYPDVIPILESSIENLLRNGSVSIPVSSLAGPARERVASSLQAVLDRNLEFFKNIEASVNAARPGPPGGPSLRSAATIGPPARARDCQIFETLVLAEAPEVWVGLQTNSGSLYIWFSSDDKEAATAGLQLYNNRRLEPAAEDKAPGGRDTDTFDRMISFGAAGSEKPRDWISRLAKFSRAAQVPVYSDCYSSFLRGGVDNHPRGRFSLPKQGSVRTVLDAFCSPDGQSPSAIGKGHSVWWPNGDAALVRSCRWLWESQTVLPASLSDRLADSLRQRKQLHGNDLLALASLSHFQVQAAGPIVPSYAPWLYAVELPSRMELRVRNLVFQPAGLKWEYLSAVDRTGLLPLLPVGPGQTPEFKADISTSVASIPSQGGTFANLAIAARWGINQGIMLVHIPLPGVDESQRLTPNGLRVRLLPQPGGR